MIEFGEGLSHEQVHQLFLETRALLTMLTHPDLHSEVDIADQALRTYTVSPPYALVVLASIGGNRAWRLVDEGTQPPARGRFPRDVLQTVPNGQRPDLLFLTIDLVEAVARGRGVRPLVDQLLVDGLPAYRILLAVVHELGWLAARADPALKSIVELTAVEAVTAEMDWYANQETSG